MPPTTHPARRPHTLVVAPTDIAITDVDGVLTPAERPGPAIRPSSPVPYTPVRYDVLHPVPTPRTLVPPLALGIAVGGIGIALTLIGIAAAIRLAGPGVEAVAHALWAAAAVLISAAVLAYVLVSSHRD
ncbi:hypothetical protein [Embleya sp. NBC_00896]|uniref:hypothetical protein n=1 Tax=Embleya sp. NBC_00896 TaxID=2975961 RepID=UPI002F910CBA|nr:hypothetical protein OG928_48155 [Embleya sp. NBC_00896]